MRDTSRLSRFVKLCMSRVSPSTVHLMVFGVPYKKLLHLTQLLSRDNPSEDEWVKGKVPITLLFVDM